VGVLIEAGELQRLCRASALLRDDAASAATIAEVARAVRMSPFHFTRRFAAVFGTTPHQARIAARLERAQAMLARGASVTEVCFASGWASLGSFSGLFTRRIGEPPSSYRRRAMVQVAWAPPFAGCLGAMAYLPASSFREA